MTPLEVAAIRGQHEEVLVLFPATTPIAGVTDWSPAGVMKYVRTDEAIRKVIVCRLFQALLDGVFNCLHTFLLVFHCLCSLILSLNCLVFIFQREKKKKEEFLLSKSEGQAAFKREDYLEAIFFYTDVKHD